jgi:hypothetical protein
MSCLDFELAQGLKADDEHAYLFQQYKKLFDFLVSN